MIIFFHEFTPQLFKELLQLTMDSVFIFNGTTYLQHDGLPMGGPASPPLASSFLCYHEKRWINDCPPSFKPVLYKRYVDDTFLLFKSHADVEAFSNYLNSRHLPSNLLMNLK